MAWRTLSTAELSAFIERLGARITIGGGGASGERCRGDLTHTRDVLEAMGKTSGELRWILAEIREHGGYCDCEVLLNLGGDDDDDDPP
jgi:uncharacterized protein DUF2695